ncbi:aldehyde dehydrogenase (NAD+) [Murinocardiopsis flavida]|uniref:Aldehyde dehydrogenase (NAD+) n=1 Tax=Murinocardiopsis flavida TaxID=645275 RepID=A0A2P8CWV8_9ACTN|nr:aldehyde dehydrogenase family protein [Murinocardiopsis flavida]PSK89426.1 aldehyde dehydrogenase (NAD+) [Murinocardiopsis flavida]
MSERGGVPAGGIPPGGLFIDGQWTPARSAATFATLDPSTEETVARVARGGPADVDDAVRAARAAFAGPCRRMAPVDRALLLTRAARTLESRAEEFAILETRDTGKPLSLSRSEIRGCVRYFDYYAGAADKIQGETVPLGPDYLDYTVREPCGVTAHITPWNAPLSMVCRSLAPALAAGNTAVVKPAEQAPLTALALADVLREAGWPAGAYNVVTGFGGEAGAALSGHPGIDSLTFTGSVPTGRAVLRAAGENITPVLLELGGKSPQIVFDDADLDHAADEIAKGIFTNAGQYCDAGSRLLVHTAVHGPLLERLAERTARLRVGPGMDDPDVGPLISAAQRDRVLGYIDAGRSAGAHVVAGAADFPKGYFVAPTLLDGVRPDMLVAREEIFGPVLAVLTFGGDDEAAELADATDYGLAAGIHTRDVDRALRFARDVRAGYVMVNEYFTGGVESPFGGSGHSGYGRERGLAALDNYTRLRNVVVRIKGDERP